jgi:hypothetical protein
VADAAGVSVFVLAGRSGMAALAASHRQPTNSGPDVVKDLVADGH